MSAWKFYSAIVSFKFWVKTSGKCGKIQGDVSCVLLFTANWGGGSSDCSHSRSAQLSFLAWRWNDQWEQNVTQRDEIWLKLFSRSHFRSVRVAACSIYNVKPASTVKTHEEWGKGAHAASLKVKTNLQIFLVRMFEDDGMRCGEDKYILFWTLHTPRKVSPSCVRFISLPPQCSAWKNIV